MADCKTTYMGLELKNPIIAGACKLTANMDTIRQIEAAGAGAIVCASLFEEQIQLEEMQMDDAFEEMSDRDPEMSRMFPKEIKHSGPKEHLMWVKEAKDSVQIPVIASLNATTLETWADYAKQIQDIGVDGIEINFYFTPDTTEKSAAEIEASQIEALQAVKRAVSIPVGVKLSYFYSNPMNVVANFDKAGADGIVLFNRLFESDIDINAQVHNKPFHLSNPGDNRLSLRFIGSLYDQVNASLCANTGIYNGDDVAKAILVGGSAVQVVSTMYQNGIETITEMVRTLTDWMDRRKYKTIDDCRGKLSMKNIEDPFVYKRAQYVDLILHSDRLLAYNF